ncbi:MAG: Superoxide dismutase SodM-like protein ChrF, partial [uncultured Craurococcus sp.]
AGARHHHRTATLPARRPARRAGPPRCAHRRGLRGRSPAAPRLRPPRRPLRDLLGGRLRRPLRRRLLPARPEAQPGRGRLAAARGRASRGAGRRFRGLGGGRRQPAAAPGPHPAARPAGAHRLGHALPAEDRPHRLPLADPALRGPRRRVPVRGALRGGRCRRALRRHALRHRGRVLEPPGRGLHLRHNGRGVRAALLGCARPAGPDRARRRHGAARPHPAIRRPARRFPGVFPHVPRRPPPTRRRHGALRRLLPVEPRRGGGDARLAFLGASGRPGRGGGGV